jgi:hypothetical protein
MDNHEEETKHAEAQSSDEGATLTGCLADLHKLATKWDAEGNFLDGEDDHQEDKIRGKVYKGCAKELKALIGGYIGIQCAV